MRWETLIRIKAEEKFQNDLQLFNIRTLGMLSVYIKHLLMYWHSSKGTFKYGWMSKMTLKIPYKKSYLCIEIYDLFICSKNVCCFMVWNFESSYVQNVLKCHKSGVFTYPELHHHQLRWWFVACLVLHSTFTWTDIDSLLIGSWWKRCQSTFF